jgi:hypothetical protein
VQVARQLERLRRARRPADDLHVGVRLEEVAELGPRRRLVVDDECPYQAGTSRRTTVPNGNDRSCTPSP